MHNAVCLKMLRADLKFCSDLVTGGMSKVQRHSCNPATEPGIDLGGEIDFLLFVDLFRHRRRLCVFSHHVNLTCHTTTRLFRFRETCDF